MIVYAYFTAKTCIDTRQLIIMKISSKIIIQFPLLNKQIMAVAG